ncbi:toll/interleukin-1 receptor domain-containing protein [Piscinibacter sakaiensis]|uniref:toll/interleukin-1 receptor domain-containing protein n=1 Tax=Piscinibacter sakaiensis TaxID=1547922 RepID=UPI003AAFB784
MHDVFISYSRRDAAIVRDLHQALAARGRDTWVDWNDIHPSAQWLREIEIAIGNADAFVFVLSPDALASDICGKELACAVRYGKRLVPVVCRDVDPSTVPETLARLQWIFLRSSAELDGAVDHIVRALDVDLSWLRTHTELLGRARTWDESGRDLSKLLRGAALQEAETWLADASGREPSPSGLHHRFVQASRRHEGARLRRLLAVSSVTLVLLAVLATWANIERSRAERNEAISKARSLGAQAELSRLERGALIERAGLLAVEAMRRLPSIEHDASLRRALAVLPQTHFLIAGSGELAFGPQRPRPALLAGDEPLLVHSDENDILIRNLGSNRILGRLAHETAVRDMVLTADGSRLVSIDVDGAVRVWSFPEGRVVGRLPPAVRGNAIAAYPSGSVVVVGAALQPVGNVVIWLDARDATSIPNPYVSRLDTRIDALRVSHDGVRLALRAGNSVEIIDSVQRRHEARLTHRHPVTDMDFSPDGARFAAASDSAVYLWQIAGGKLERRVANGVNVDSVVFSTRRAELLTAGINGVATLWDAEGYGRIRQFQHQGPVTLARFINDESLVLTASNDGTVRAWDRASGNEITRAVHGVFIADAAHSDDGERVVSVGADGGLRVWSPWPGERLRRLPPSMPRHAMRYTVDGGHVLVRVDRDHWSVGSLDGRELLRVSPPRAVHGVAVSADERLVALALVDNTVQIHRVGSGERLHSLAHRGTVDAMAFSQDGRQFATGTRQEEMLRLWSIESGSLRWQREQGTMVSAVAFSPDGSRVAAALFDKQAFDRSAPKGTAGVALWTSLEGKPVARLAHDHDTKAIAFSPDGTHLVTAGSDRIARVWRIAESRVERELAHQFPVESVAFSSDGRLVATGATDHWVRVWSARTGDELARIHHDDSVAKVRFADDDQSLLVIAGPFVHHHPLHAEALIQMVCARLTRELTVEERQRFLPDEPANTTCPGAQQPQRPIR